MSRATIKRNGRIAGIEPHCRREVLRGHVFRALLSRTVDGQQKFKTIIAPEARLPISQTSRFLAEPLRNTDTISPMSWRKSTSSISIKMLQGVSR